MKITDIRIEGFGVWRDLKLQELSPQLTAFYGANEAGKTTLMQFVRSVLYGMSQQRRNRYLPPVLGGEPGGTLGIVHHHQPLELRRIADRGPDDIGHVTVTDQEENVFGDRLLREALAEVDEQTYNNVFAVGLREIQELGALSDTKAAQWLYRLTSGLDRVSLYDVIQQLRTTRRSILAGPEQSSTLIELDTRRDVLRGEIEQLKRRSHQWAQLAVRIHELDTDIESHEAKVRHCEHHARTIETAVGLKPNWRKRVKISSQLQQLSGGIQLPDDALQRLEELSRRIEEHGREADILEGQRRQLREDSEQLGINELLVKNSHRIEALGEQRDWVQSLERQIDDLSAEAEQFETRLSNEQQRLGKALGVADHSRLKDISAAEIEELQPYIQTARATQKQVDSAQRALDLQNESERSLKAQIETAIVGGERHGLPMDIQEASDLVARLRRRQQVERRLEKARQHEDEMEEQSHELLDDQVMPLSLFGWSLAAVVVGSLMAGLWLLVPDSPLGRYGSWLALAGVGISIFSFLFKYFVEDAAADKLDGCHHQMDLLSRQIQEAQAEKEQLDAELPMTDGSAVMKLEAAEKHLTELENMLPVEAQRRQAGYEVASAESRFTQAQAQLDEALAAWKAKLIGLGFSEKLDPQVFLSIAERYESLSELESRAKYRREDVAQRQREHAAITRRVQDVTTEVGCLPQEEECPQTIELLGHLVEQHTKQLSAIERRDGIVERAKELKAEEANHRRAIAGLKRRRAALFQAADCEDEIAYRQLAEQQQQALKLQKQRKAVSREITAAIGSHVNEETIAEFLSPERISQLDELWEAASEELGSAQIEMKTCLDERGSLRQEQRALADDRTLAERQLELNCVEKQIEDARQTWREHATVNRILERIRVHYEANRQPETLAEATTYMAKLTGGEYTRVWTPLADDVLLVENSAGESIRVEMLSRGTREQLFLSVRLALAATFARRGVNLPMVLDDVLVNFDAVRAQRAAEVLCDFAAGGHQLLVFTCHEHVWQMFQSVDADCRRLPSRSEKPIAEPQPDLTEVIAEPETEILAETSVELLEQVIEVEDEATVYEPALIYEYPFEETEEVVTETEVEIELPSVEAVYGWDPEANELSHRSQGIHLEPRRA